jgi:imidazolonepropionase-like amidohydrolase
VKIIDVAMCTLLLVDCSLAQQQNPPSTFSAPPPSEEFVVVDAPVVVLKHIRIIDGTGSAAVDDQSIVIAGGVIRAVQPSGSEADPVDAKVLDLKGYTAIPGLVGMHEHLFYITPTGHGHLPSEPRLFTEMAFSFPRLYLAAGVTTIRTAGSIEPYADLNLKRSIDLGQTPGPKMHLTAPFLEGQGSNRLQVHILTGQDDISRTVNYWADQGFTSFKTYINVSRDELRTVIKTAHARGLKVAGHLCAVGFREAASLGIDSLEHGLYSDAEFLPDKHPDVCPSSYGSARTMLSNEPDSQPVTDMIRDLVQHHVAITSTLVVREVGIPNHALIDQRIRDVLSPPSLMDYLLTHAAAALHPDPVAELVKKEMKFERAFVKAGGFLMAGLDPTATNGAAVAGFGDQREVELLVEAGFTPLEAIHIATANGAKFLGEDQKIGTLQVGKQADIVVIKGDPSKDINDIEKVELVFKDGKGYDSHKLVDSVRGLVGLR